MDHVCPPSYDHWRFHARQWFKVGPPLRPAREDLDLLERLVHERLASLAEERRTAVLLGVTPEIARMSWPTGTRLLAIDHNRGMIECVWPRVRTVAASVSLADWRAIPLGKRSAGVVVGDGCYSMLVNAQDYDLVSAELVRILAPEGSLIVRLFVGPEVKESPEAVFDDLLAGRIGNFHVFKWRLAMSLTSGTDSVVRVHDIWEAWEQAGVDVAALFDRLAWSPDVVATLTVYRGSDVRFTYPPLSEVQQRLEPFFRQRKIVFPSYELGDRCPTLVLTPR
jgi:hypothetical protein